MKLGVCAQALYGLPRTTAFERAAGLGFEAVELPVDARNPFMDLDALLLDGTEEVERELAAAGLEISALSNHQEGQLLLGPHGEDTDPIFAGTPEEKSARGAERLVASAELARRMGVGTVLAFTGCEDYSRWFPWPLADGYDRMAGPFRERLLPVLDEYSGRGVTLALECHPRQFAYNLETARWALDLVDDHPALGFNLDPANLLLAGMDPVDFVAELGDRIRHVHAKDGQLVRRHAGRSGLLAHGPWDRPGRGFRFRVPGWGDLDWREIITELHVAGFRGVLSVEHEDPTMGRTEGLVQAAAHLRPLLLHEAPDAPFW
ncbi:MAG: sugar phosphate isomerase/epimerase family protein [Microthrixaceae bacterium]